MPKNRQCCDLTPAAASDSCPAASFTASPWGRPRERVHGAHHDPQSGGSRPCLLASPPSWRWVYHCLPPWRPPEQCGAERDLDEWKNARFNFRRLSAQLEPLGWAGERLARKGNMNDPRQAPKGSQRPAGGGGGQAEFGDIGSFGGGGGACSAFWVGRIHSSHAGLDRHAEL